MYSMNMSALWPRMGTLYRPNWVNVSLLACAIKIAVFPAIAYAEMVNERAESNGSGFAVVDSEYLSKAKNTVRSKPVAKKAVIVNKNTAATSSVKPVKPSVKKSPTVANKTVPKTAPSMTNINNRQVSSPQPAGQQTVSVDSNISYDGEYIFDDSLVLGAIGAYGGTARFNQPNSVIPGVYQVDVFLNNKFISRKDIEFKTQSDAKVEPCIDDAFLDSLSLLSPPEAMPAGCIPLSARINGAFTQFDTSKLRLDISIPQALLKRTARGYVDPKNWDAGNTIAFANYNTSSSYSSRSDTTSTYLGLNSGINLGLWRVRQQSSYNYDENSGGKWRSIRAYVQRAIPEISSELTVGDGFTSGRLLSGMAYRGFQIGSDDRMMPETQRGYAPVVRGVARTNATVVVRQNGNILYQTTVPAGPFVIDDLYPTNYGGDIDVTVTEADGQVSSFSIPFSAVPDSLRQGAYRYSMAVGRARSVGDGKDIFGELTYQRGLSNAITLNTGTRLAKDYYSLVLGSAYTNWLGAFGVNLTYSNAKIVDGQSEDGWMTNLSYSRTIQSTGTTVSFAGYRYSTKGYRDLSDVLGIRDAYERGGAAWTSSTYLQRTRLEVTMNQTLDRYGSMFVSASKQYYRDSRPADTQIQAGYANNWGNLNYSINLSRMYNYSSEKNENMISLSLSMPLGSSIYAPVGSINSIRSPDGDYSSQATVTGLLDEANTVSYSLNANHDSRDDRVVWGGTLQKRFPVVTVNGSYNRNASDWSGTFGLRGAIVGHSGGVTLGPYVGDTFALVEAKEAKGAKLSNAQNVTIDGFGYAIVPSLSPYRYNTITLNSDGMDSNVELRDNQKIVAPYAGAVVKVKFETISGYPLLLQTTMSDKSALPMGANVYNEDGAVVGMVGQGSQVFARAEERQGKLYIRWGDEPNEQCSMSYTINGKENQVLYKVKAVCQLEQQSKPVSKLISSQPLNSQPSTSQTISNNGQFLRQGNTY